MRVFAALVVGLAGRSVLVDFNFGWLLGMICVALLLLSRTRGIGRRGGAVLVALYAVFVVVQLVYVSG
jgi:Ca2+/Na+ antiporter